MAYVIIGPSNHVKGAALRYDGRVTFCVSKSAWVARLFPV